MDRGAIRSAAALSRTDIHEEIANSVTHGLGVVASIAALAVMVSLASLRGSAWHVVGCAVFGTSLVVLYGASTLYHSLPGGWWKAVLRVVEHSCIYLLIAGTYTPFTLTVLRGGWGFTLLGLVWGLALVLIVFKIFFAHRYPLVSIGGYVLMGWLAIVAIRPMLERMPLPGVLWIFGGGVFYTGGLVFYFLDERVRYFHMVWHLCVLAGSACHVAAVLVAVLPPG